MNDDQKAKTVAIAAPLAIAVAALMTPSKAPTPPGPAPEALPAGAPYIERTVIRDGALYRIDPQGKVMTCMDLDPKVPKCKK